MLLQRILAVLGLLFSATAISFEFNHQSPIAIKADDPEEYPVPGDNPLLYCDVPDDYLLTVQQVDLVPNPPTAGKPLSIVASGYLKEDVEPGAYVVLQVKYGLITLVKQTVDLCDQVKNVELTCPLEKGDLTIKKDVDLPREIPPGQYTVLADAYTKNDEKITCLTAKVRFGR